MTVSKTFGFSSTVCYDCGPVTLRLDFDDPTLPEALHSLLNQYDAPWPSPEIIYHSSIETGAKPRNTVRPTGRYLQSYRLRVDRSGDTLHSLSEIGVWMDFDLARHRARILVPDHPDRETVIEEIEQQLVLLLARGWANSGWTPLHGGSLIPPEDDRCVLVCAPSGVGKTTFIASLLRQGWRTLGDDKILLRREGNQVIARAMARRFHLHPATVRWFPETFVVADAPRYSRWTEKRVVQIESLWPDRLLNRAVPMAVIRLERGGSLPLMVEPLDPTHIFATLLQQVAVPSDAQHARSLMACVAALAPNLRGARVMIGENAFDSPTLSTRLLDTMRDLLP
ncbi:MAG: hypothetical protein KKF30_01685 [Proteobacteria bacterium]|nr:hypothetical protein [Pseudomonadota bacterium]MBU4471455.1 hypothetical protein [Pseudomonadota bacterium]MCG2752462.1 hypothetical protein [Desulfobacteraceae bacterium]